MAHLTDDKRTLILTCQLCGEEVRYNTGYPFASKTVKDTLESVLSAWQDKSETCDACLFGRTRGASDEQLQPQVSETIGPKGPVTGTTVEILPVPNKIPSDIAHDNTPPRLYDVRELQSMLHMSKNRVLKFIREEIIPLSGCTRVGNRYLVYAWALNHALSQRTVPARAKRVRPPSQMMGLARQQKLNRKHPLPTSSETQSSSSGEKS